MYLQYCRLNVTDMNKSCEILKLILAKIKTLMISDILHYLIPVMFVITVSAYMLWHRAWFSPDQFFAVAILAALILGRTKQFIKDWLPFLLLLFSYEYLRGLIPMLSSAPHIFPMITVDKLLFGFIPTIELQTILYNPNVTHWYDYLAVILYISHFVVPMIIAFLLWIYDRNYFKKYSWALLILSYMAFFTFIIFPAMPPWMAANKGYIPPLNKIMDQVFLSFAHPISVPSIYQFFGADLVAAVPSLHAAYPWLIFLFIFQKLRFLSMLLIPYVIGVWFAVVYLGEHYVIDVVAGITYASVAYSLIIYRPGNKLLEIWKRR